MKTINLKLGETLYYPVGREIRHDIPIINAMAKAIKKILPKELVDIVLVCTGSSGTIIAAIIASQIKYSMIYHVKKKGETAHSSNYYDFNSNDYIIVVDDFISSGVTMERIKTNLNNECRNFKKVNCVALGGQSGSYDLELNLDPDILIYNQNY